MHDGLVQPVSRDEDGLAAIMGAGITPREHLDEVAEVLIPAKGRVKPPPVLPEWRVLDARGYILDGVNVNDAEYFGLLKGLAMALERGIRDIVVVGDSRIVIQQVQGLINCNQPNLQRRLAECETLKKRFREIRAFLNDDLDRFSSMRLKKISKVADLFVLDDRGVLYRLPHSVRGRPRDALDNLRLVVLSSLQEDMLHHAHEDSKVDIKGSLGRMRSCAPNSTGPVCMRTSNIL
ncbi:hypothetical protein PHMEG_00025395 [Phytophthora megakarya]|uniref:RNase H type-1 domain-containing protein n=1 Tax=Phytophthora megakarya TaxID=4795 RepID=A0A225VB78_9STRA|nr:hypothetical protein PHMEG_00025395 [Phytophthora megakarya]